MGTRLLNITLLLVVGMLLLGGVGHSTPGGYEVYATPENDQRVVSWSSCLLMEPTTSTPFAGSTTPSGCVFFTHSASPPVGFAPGELYLYVDDLRGWEQK
jgi:hypothetical protein